MLIVRFSKNQAPICFLMMMGGAALPLSAQDLSLSSDTVTSQESTSFSEAQRFHATQSSHRSITVSGQANLATRPDAVVVILGVETMQETMEASKRLNATTLVNALQAIKALGVSDDNIEIDQVSIDPLYRDTVRTGVMAGYLARNAFSVTVESPSKAEAVIAAALQQGVNYVHGMSYHATEESSLRERALTEALLAAKAKAQLMAATLGMRLGSVMSVKEEKVTVDYRSGQALWNGGAHWANVSSGHLRVPDVAEAPSAGKLGDVVVRAQVAVTFELNAEQN